MQEGKIANEREDRWLSSEMRLKCEVIHGGCHGSDTMLKSMVESPRI